VEVNKRLFQLIFVKEPITSKVALTQLSTNASEDSDTSLFNLLSYDLCHTSNKLTQASQSECSLNSYHINLFHHIQY